MNNKIKTILCLKAQVFNDKYLYFLLKPTAEMVFWFPNFPSVSWAETECKQRKFVKAQSGSLTSPLQIPEVFCALEGLELIWLSGFSL